MEIDKLLENLAVISQILKTPSLTNQIEKNPDFGVKLKEFETLVEKFGSSNLRSNKPLPVEPLQQPKRARERSIFKLMSLLPKPKQRSRVAIVTKTHTRIIGNK